MPTLFSILEMTARSLAAHRGAAATAAHNLANAATPGYARQTAVLGAALPAEGSMNVLFGRGAALLSISQTRDPFVEAQFAGALAASARSAQQAKGLQSLRAFDPDGGVTRALGDFYSALRALSQNPGDTGLRRVAVGAAQGLALAVRTAAEEIASARSGLDAKLSGIVAEANNLLSQVATLNRRIAVAHNSGGQPNDLLDERQRALDRLAELLGARAVRTGGPEIQVVLSSGESLVAGDRAAVLSVLPAPSNGGHLEVWRAAPDGSPAQLLSRPGGAAEGLLLARDGTLAEVESGLDTLALDLAEQLNAVHRAGFGLDGSGGRDLFAAGASMEGAARRFSVDFAIATDPSLLAVAGSPAALPGDATNLFALIATERAPLSTGSDATGSWAALSSRFGAEALFAADAAEQYATILQHLSTLRESASGVSIDEEMVALARSQRAFEAVSRVIATTDELLETLIRLV